MGEMRHTAGPWVPADDEWGVYAGDETQQICIVISDDDFTWLDDDERAEFNCEAAANVRLIVAAPDLFDAAQKIVASVHTDIPDIVGKNDGWIYDTLGSAMSEAYFAARAAITKATTP